MGGGLLLVMLTFVGWYWLAEFGCQMSSGMCRDFHIPMPWEEPEMFSALAPFLLLGTGLFAVGKWVIRP